MSTVPTLPLTQIKRTGVEVLASLRNDSPGASAEAGVKLVNMAKDFGLNMRDYLTLAVDPRLSEDKERYFDGKRFLTGYEATLAYLNLPVRDDFEQGVVLQAAAETFQTFPGTRALFPEVIDDMVQWKYRQEQIERVEGMLAASRTINGVEMLTTVVDDKEADYQGNVIVAELARIPVKSIRTTQQSVAIYKHGMGYRTSYEFERRARLDLLTPYANRANRELERSKVRIASLMLLNGDSVHSAAGVDTQSTFDSGATAGKISYKGLLKWLVNRAKAGTPVDTVVGNWDAYIEWLMLFAVPTTANTRVDAENLAAAGFNIGAIPLLQGSVNFVLSSSMTDNYLLGYSRGDTMEELIESGSMINESERSIGNQAITYYKTENTGYRLVFGDTRRVYNFGA